MPETFRIGLEIVFTAMYLIVLWWIVITMARRQAHLTLPESKYASLSIWAFGLLALGDTGHIGARVAAYLVGDLRMTLQVFGQTIAPVSLGTLATSITLTFFYGLMLMIWQRRFEKPYGWFGGLLFASAVVRLALLAFPQNAWNSVDNPQDWGIYRNIPFLVQGLGVAYLMLRDAIATRDRTFTWIGILILVSYAFYAPVVLFAQQIPILGMLMLPKTLAYAMIAVLVYVKWFTALPRAQTSIMQP